MTRKLLYALALIFLIGASQLPVLAGSPAPAAGPPPNPTKYGAASEPDKPHANDYILVKLRATAEESRSSSLPRFEPIYGNWYRVPTRMNESAVEAMARLSALPDVELVELDYRVHAAPPRQVEKTPDHLGDPNLPGAFPNDPLYPEQWNFPAIQAPEAWDSSRGGGVVVAVVDSGVAQGSDLACQTFVDEFNALTNESGAGVAYDDYGHGTHIAGTIAQCTDNGIGVAGMAFEATLMPVKVLNRYGSGTISDVAQGVEWARTHGADVINLSLGSPCGTQTWPACSSSILNDALTAAAADDIFVAAAAGNNDQAAVSFPANHPDVVAVAAVDTNLDRAYYSNRGSALSVSAPGGDLDQDIDGDGQADNIAILQQTFHGGSWGYWYMDGTSMATAHVSAAAALLRAIAPQATRQEMQSLLEDTALDRGPAGPDVDYGYGVIQIADALAAIAQPPETPMPRVWLPLIQQEYQRPIPTPTPTVTPTPIPRDCTELVDNGGFEENSSWVFLVTTTKARYSTRTTHSGARSVELGILPGTKQALGSDALDGGVYSIAYQAVSIPTGQDETRLSFWYRPGTTASEGDWQQVTLRDARSSQVIAKPLDVLENGDDWRYVTYDVNEHQGRDVLIYLEAYNDSGEGPEVTWMNVDDVSLQACTAP